MTHQYIPTEVSVSLIDALEQRPPPHNKLLLLSKYGVLSLGVYQEEFHVAWAPLPKIPESVKRRLSEQTV